MDAQNSSSQWRCAKLEFSAEAWWQPNYFWMEGLNGNSCIAFFWMLPQLPSSLRFALQDSLLTIANMATWPKKQGVSLRTAFEGCSLASYVKPFSFTRVSCPVRNVCKRLWPSLLELRAFWSRRLESMPNDVAMQSGHSKTQHTLDS